MITNVTHWHISHVQTTQDILTGFTCPYSSYRVLEFGNVLHISNWDTAQNVILQRSKSQVKITGTIIFLDF